MPIGSFLCSDQRLLLSSGDVFLSHRSTGLLDDLRPTDVRHAEKPPIDDTQAGLPRLWWYSRGASRQARLLLSMPAPHRKKQAVIKRHGQLPGSWSDAFPARCSGFGLGSVRNESGQPARMGPAAD